MSKQEELRKLQFTGKSSFIVSLPKEWVRDHGLKQGDQVAVGRNGSSILEIRPMNLSTPSPQEAVTIVISNNDNDASILRKLIALYFLHYQTIHIRPKGDRITPSQRTTIRSAVTVSYTHLTLPTKA